jgi:hypothetical protein
MSLQVIYFWSKKIHKVSMWVVVVLGSWMMLSGFLMHRELEGSSLPAGIEVDFFRFWHNALSQYFLVFLLAQMVTGLLMWGVPKLLSAKPQRPGPQT